MRAEMFYIEINPLISCDKVNNVFLFKPIAAYNVYPVFSLNHIKY